MRHPIRKYLANAFAPSMIADAAATLDFTALELTEARQLAADAESFVGHPDTAARFATLLGRPVETNRGSLTLGVGDALLIGQHDRSRLPEGATSLPDEAAFRWIRIVRTR